jgi:anaerobic dimethyl sulfoxide reductase subunit B (iron-sulfur subunit)
MRMSFFFDQSRCMSCSTCVVACKDYYDVNPGQVSYRKQDVHETPENPSVFYSLSIACNHCKEPACLSVCPVQAITKRNDGIVLVDRSKCQAYKNCISACPFAEPNIADDRQEPESKDSWAIKHPMQKCTMCAALLDKGEQPICVRACPVRAIEVGDYDELLRKHPGSFELTNGRFPYAYVNNINDTGPSLIIKPRKDLTISGSL